MYLPNHILVIRLSAPGDVAMTIPVLHSFQKKYPSVQLTILTNRKLTALFFGLNANLVFAETKVEHEGITGLIRLFNQLNKKYSFDAVADLHNVMRSKVIRILFWLKGITVASIDKGRVEKKLLTAKEKKVLRQLPSTFQRYRQVFTHLGFSFEFDFTTIFSQIPSLSNNIVSIVKEKKTAWIGIAPFAAYNEKMYPLQKMKSVIKELSKQNKIIFFGSKDEANELEKWNQIYQGTVNVAGKLTLLEELFLMSHLDVMVCMDSANMHFASLVNVPVVSVWGSTHPFAGFMGWNQLSENAVQLNLSCRPCSVFGNKPCFRGDHACMNELDPLLIINTIKRNLHL